MEGIQLARKDYVDIKNLQIDQNINNFSRQLAQTDENLEEVQRYTKHPIVEKLLKGKYTMAHRGLMNVYPENTIVAFYESYKRGIVFFELDFRKTLDGFWVCIHDENTLRTTSVDMVVANSTLASLRTLKQVNAKNAVIYGEPLIATLEEVFEFIRDTKVIVNINFDYGLASSDVPTILGHINDYGIENNVIVQYHAFKSHTDKLAMVFEVPETEQGFKDASTKSNIIASYGYGDNVNASTNVMILASKYNVPVIVYGTSTYGNFNTIDRLGVNAIMVDYLWFRGGVV